MKKFISMLLVLVMLSTSVSTTLAVSYSEDIEASAEVNRIVDEYSGDTQKKGQLKKMVSEDLELLKKANLTSQVDIFDISDNDSFHSEWIYSYAMYANTAYRGIPALAASKKVLETL